MVAVKRRMNAARDMPASFAILAMVQRSDSRSRRLASTRAMRKSWRDASRRCARSPSCAGDGGENENRRDSARRRDSRRRRASVLRAKASPRPQGSVAFVHFTFMKPFVGPVQIWSRSDKSSSRSAMAGPPAGKHAENRYPTTPLESPERSEEKRDPLFPRARWRNSTLRTRSALRRDHERAGRTRERAAHRAGGGERGSHPHARAFARRARRIGDSIHDIIRFIEPEVRMIGTGGWRARGRRCSSQPSPNAVLPCRTRVSCCTSRWEASAARHRTSRSKRGRSSAVRERMNRIFARETKQPYDKIVADTQRNFWMNAAQAQVRPHRAHHRASHGV